MTMSLAQAQNNLPAFGAYGIAVLLIRGAIERKLRGFRGFRATVTGCE